MLSKRYSHFMLRGWSGGNFSRLRTVPPGKCLVLTTFLSPSRHSPRSPSEEGPPHPLSSWMCSQSMFSPPNFHYKLKPSGTSYRRLCSAESHFCFTSIRDPSRECSAVLELWVSPHSALGPAANHENRESLGQEKKDSFQTTKIDPGLTHLCTQNTWVIINCFISLTVSFLICKTEQILLCSTVVETRGSHISYACHRGQKLDHNFLVWGDSNLIWF